MSADANVGKSSEALNAEKPANYWLVILETWVPALITAIIGGAMVAILVPFVQSSYSEAEALNRRKLELWESIGYNFTQFINSHFQLVTIEQEIRKQEETNTNPPVSLLNRKEEYRQSRDAYASKLNGDLILAPFYFEEPIASLTAEYRAWILAVANSTIDNVCSAGCTCSTTATTSGLNPKP